MEDATPESDSGQITIPFPEVTPNDLRISVGPGVLHVAPGAAEPWVSGHLNDAIGGIQPRVELDGGSAHISQKGGKIRLFGRSGGADAGLSPGLDLRLGTARPYALTIEGGANDIRCDLGGLPLTAFKAQFGAGRIRLDASVPNPAEMSRLHVSTGATNLSIVNLNHFNASEIVIEGGAASIKVNFGGALRRDCHARISTGVASLEITLPTDLAARVSAHTSLGSLDIGDGFITRGGGFWTPAALNADAPVLTLDANASLGSLKVRIDGVES